MKKLLVAALAGACLVTGALAADALKSGPQVGQALPGPLHPLNVTGEMAGKKHCLYCQNGDNPVAMIFARECSPELVKLIKKIDECTAKNSKCEMGSFVVFLGKAEDLEKKLKE